jgi:hypothetical protein
MLQSILQHLVHADRISHTTLEEGFFVHESFEVRFPRLSKYFIPFLAMHLFLHSLRCLQVYFFKAAESGNTLSVARLLKFESIDVNFIDQVRLWLIDWLIDWLIGSLCRVINIHHFVTLSNFRLWCASIGRRAHCIDGCSLERPLDGGAAPVSQSSRWCLDYN